MRVPAESRLDDWRVSATSPRAPTPRHGFGVLSEWEAFFSLLYLDYSYVSRRCSTESENHFVSSILTQMGLAIASLLLVEAQLFDFTCILCVRQRRSPGLEYLNRDVLCQVPRFAMLFVYHATTKSLPLQTGCTTGQGGRWVATWRRRCIPVRLSMEVTWPGSAPVDVRNRSSVPHPLFQGTQE